MSKKREKLSQDNTKSIEDLKKHVKKMVEIKK